MVFRGFVRGHPGFGRAHKVPCQEEPLLVSAADGCQLPMVSVVCLFLNSDHRVLLPCCFLTQPLRVVTIVLQMLSLSCLSAVSLVARVTDGIVHIVFAFPAASTLDLLAQ